MIFPKNRFVVRTHYRLDGGMLVSAVTLSYERIQDAWKVASRINNRYRHEGTFATIEDRG